MEKNYDYVNQFSSSSSSHSEVPIPVSPKSEAAEKIAKTVNTTLSSPVNSDIEDSATSGPLSAASSSRGFLTGDIPHEVLRVFFDHMRYRLKMMRSVVDLDLLANLSGVNTLFNVNMQPMWKAFLQSQIKNPQALHAIQKVSNEEAKKICEEILKTDFIFKDSPQETADAAICSNCPTILKLMLNEGVNPNAAIHKSFLLTSAIACAVQTKDPTIIQILLFAGSNMNERDEMGFSPLQYDLFYPDILRTILEARDSNHNTYVPLLDLDETRSLVEEMKLKLHKRFPEEGFQMLCEAQNNLL